MKNEAVNNLKEKLTNFVNKKCLDNYYDYMEILFIADYLNARGHRGISELGYSHLSNRNDGFYDLMYEVDAVRDNSDRLEVIEHLLACFKQKVASSSYCLDQEPWVVNLIKISRIFQLNENEIDFLMILFHVHHLDLVDNTLSQIQISTTSKLLEVMEDIWALPRKHLQMVLAKESGLISNEIILLDLGGFTSSLKGRASLDINFIQAVGSEGCGDDELQSYFFKYEHKTTLRHESFLLKMDELEKLKKIMCQSKRENLIGINILIYGPAGTGKTEFIKMVAEKSGIKLAVIQIKDSSENSYSSPKRNHQYGDSYKGKMLALRFCSKICESQKNNVILMDDADDILNMDDGSISKFSGGSSRNRPTLLKALEENKTPVIWIVNNYQEIDPAIKRRFTWSLKFDYPRPRERIEIWKNVIEETKVNFSFGESELKRLAYYYPLTPALITNCIKSSQMISDDQVELDELEHQLQRSCELMYDIKPKNMSSKFNFSQKDYNVDWIHSSYSVEKIVKAMSRFVNDHGHHEKSNSLSLCIGGRSGTGKTAFAHYLSHQLCRKIIVKKSSDLFSPFVGVTEANIADAFRVAEEQEAILFFDELDSFFKTRLNLDKPGVCSHINEVLTQMDSFKGVFIGASNFLNKLDYAYLRRFHMKVEFYPLHNELKMGAFKTFFPEIKLPGAGERKAFYKSLLNITCLCLGDFKAVQVKLQYLDEIDPYVYLKALASEVDDWCGPPD